MKRFKTYVITKKSIKKFLICTVAVILTIIYINVKDNGVIDVFSDNAINIIDNSIVSDDFKLKANKLANDILGFDINKPTTILDNSSASIKNTVDKSATTSPSPIPTEKPEFNNILPSHEDILNASGLKIKNDTGYNVNLDALCSLESDIKLTRDAPEVLIMHTHTTECYNGDAMSGESERTTNENYNVCSIGSIIKDTLNEYGIQAIHDKTIHDYPTYQSAYSKAMKTIEKNIESYPTIKVVLDIHRDAYIYQDGSKLKVTTNINGESVAQGMLVLGTNCMGLTHDNWQLNLILASKIQNAAEILYPGLMRPLNLRQERFNMHLTSGSVLIEIGSNGNTLQEAQRSAKYISEAIAAALLNG